MKKMIVLIGVLYAFAVNAGESEFEKRMMSKALIPEPKTAPFVSIFFEGGKDTDKYGFRSGGNMTVDDWAKVLTHVGYLYPYSVFKPHFTAMWKNHSKDITIRGAVKAGKRYIGGSIMGCPDNDTGAINTRKSYSDEIGTKITHFFHDYEPHYGAIGGSGKYTLKYNVEKAGLLETKKSSCFNPGIGKAMESFSISFDFYLHNFIFGGSMAFLNCSDNNFTSGRNGWAITINNKKGYKGNSYITFQGRGKSAVESLAMNSKFGKTWHHVEITVDGSSKTDWMDVTINIDDSKVSHGKILRPRARDWQLFLGTLRKSKDRRPKFDNIRICGIKDGKKTQLAVYMYSEQKTKKTGNISILKDMSGNSNDLLAVNNKSTGWEYVENIDKSVQKQFNKIKQYLVDDIVRSRKDKKLAPPELITNWRVGSVAGRFKYWKKTGLSHASTATYLYGDVKPDLSNISNILKLDEHKWSRAGGSKWLHTWIGNFKSEKTLSPEQWQTIITLNVLDGVRWFSVFTSMSNAHLGPQSWEYPADHKKMADNNADCLYAMAQTAEWFQPYASSLLNSEWLELPEAKKVKGILQARKNKSSGEMWFAAWTPKTQNLIIKLSRQSGIVINMKTGKKVKINNAEYQLNINSNSVPYYFKPSE